MGILPELVKSAQSVSMVVTRAQAKGSADEARKAVCEMLPYGQSDIDLDIDHPAAGKIPKTRRQRRLAKLQGTADRYVSQVPKPNMDVDDVWEPPSNFSDLQKNDESLKNAFTKVVEIDGEKTGVAADLSGEFYFVRDDVLYHQPEDGAVEQMVVQSVLEIRCLVWAMTYRGQDTWALSRH